MTTRLNLYTEGDCDWVGSITAEDLFAALTLAHDRLEDLDPDVAVRLGLASPGTDPTDAVDQLGVRVHALMGQVVELTS